MSFLACLYKDIKLFLSASGLLALILPLLLLPALIFGADDLTATGLMTSFPIAVRDEDDTVMSHSLITQLADVDLFSEVRVLDGETDAQAIAAGAVAVATIPRDFFYDLYTMSDCPVAVTVNSAEPLKASVFTSVFRSVMGIINSDHAASLAVYTFVYGELTPEEAAAMRESSGDRLVYDALARQRFFAGLTPGPDLATALLRRLSACAMGALALFFALTSAKTFPEERRLGVLPRLRAAGAGYAPFILSKLLTAALLSMPAAALVSALLKMSFLYVSGAYLLLLVCAFAVMSALAVCARSAASAQRLGNALMLLSLVLGGVLWPASALPELLRPLSALALPRYALLALEARAAGLPAAETLRLLLPLLPIALVPAALAALLSRAGTRETAAAAPFGTRHSPELPDMPARRQSYAARAARLTALRLRGISGGPAALTLTLSAALICGLCAGALRTAAPSALRLAVWDRDGTRLSRDLVESLRCVEGVELLELDGAEAAPRLLAGEIECLLTVGEGYEDSLTSGAAPALTLTASPSSVSAQAARELAAGRAVAQYRAEEAGADAAALLGRELTESEGAALRSLIAETERSLPPLYSISYTSGSPPADPFAPSPMALAGLAVLFTLLTAAAFASAPDAKSASRRLRSVPHGPALGLVSDLAALTLLGFATALLVLLPAGAAAVLPALAMSLAVSVLALLLAALTSAEGRVDALAPLAAMLICLLGGCFMDLSALPPALRALTYLSPPALASLPPRVSLPALSAYALLLIPPTFRAVYGKK